MIQIIVFNHPLYSPYHTTNHCTHLELHNLISVNVQVISTRSVLTEKEEELLAKHGDGTEPVPKPNWGGYRVVPHMVEFWQGQSTRIHDRIRFRKMTEDEDIDVKMTQKGENGWAIERLAP